MLEGTFRFVSVDGSHDADTVLSDLHLAERMLVKGGVVALDDWNDTGQWPGVKEGWDRYYTWAEERRREPRLRAVWMMENKLILCNDPTWTSDYRQILLDTHVTIEPPRVELAASASAKIAAT